MVDSFYLGFDFGTSGVRAVTVDQNHRFGDMIKIESSNYDHCSHWSEVLWQILSQLPLNIRQNLRAIALSGTSSTVLLCDEMGKPLTNPLWYHDSRGKDTLKYLREFVPQNHLTLSATSSLAKLYWWYGQSIFNQARYFLHQADYLGFLLHGKLGISDYHNALKLGYDVENLIYPPWLKNQPFSHLLPMVKQPGETVATITEDISKKFNINPRCVIKTGTTDSIAAFLASGVTTPGEGVTSLGSTLVLKLLSETKIDDSRYGIYSHRFGNLWLTGGASNTGGAVLKHFFSSQQLEELSADINPNSLVNYHYYPLINKGDRFPINNPELPPKLTPKPNNPTLFLQGILEGIAEIEQKGYQLLQELGANHLTKVYTAGGGSVNEKWQEIRALKLNVPVTKSPYSEACYGVAILAKGN
ncbi:FGGY-family carbohydrate kinase [Cyanobacterium stanieri LEGE 03274]|uniref:FGGY-family carbohydrate kinase n=1 Tax=Cyanobacterium stanieri LEGE 03274 TaxID=1828756 RepID=A0ABR9V1X5_9CHRO|nr:FGGY-family carbohydrate kinase [Cyanobacterium stanieri LEGE 03274]